jgi:hypothetical protein
MISITDLISDMTTESLDRAPLELQLGYLQQPNAVLIEMNNDRVEVGPGLQPGGKPDSPQPHAGSRRAAPLRESSRGGDAVDNRQLPIGE